ncbi:cytochrome c [Acidobacteria bacterium ACD]|nr:cytochrome c [Acidobacteria bacterium ACD]RIK22530.1 MAG: cytochrome C [Anaerolineae bacterium]
MKTVLKWLGILLVVLVVIGLLAGAGLFFTTNSDINKTYDVAVAPITLPTDAASIEEGARIATIRGCNGCHTPDFGGGTFLNDPMLGVIETANITPGEGSAVSGYTVEDWDRAVRHGINPEGKSLMIMPSYEFAGLSDEQFGQLIAYMQTVPAVDREHPDPKVGLLGRVLLATGQLPLLPAALVDQTAKAPVSVAPTASVEYGAYLSTACIGCHKPDFSGGPSPDAAPGDPPAANLTPAGPLSKWTMEEFKTVLRTGVSPEGRTLDPEVMPWMMTQHFTDTEIEALWLYLQSIPPVVPKS